MLPRATSSSSSGAREIQWPRRWARIRASSPRRRANSAASWLGFAEPWLTARAMSSGRRALPGVMRVALAVPSPLAPAPDTPTEMSPWPLSCMSVSGEVLTGASRPHSWCSRWRGGSPCPGGIQRRNPWNRGRWRRWPRPGPPRWTPLHCGGCRGPGRCAGPWPRRARAGTLRGRGTGRGWSGRILPRWARRFLLGVRWSCCGFLLCLLHCLLFRVGGGGFAHPSAVLVCLAAPFQALGVAGAAAGQDFMEFIPVQRPVLPLLGFLVEPDVLVRKRQAEDLDLLHHHADKPVAELVIAEPLDVPGHGLLGVGRIVVRRAEHHQGGGVPAVDRFLCHLLLLGGAVGEFQQDLEALALVEGLFLADPHHGPAVGAEGGAAERHLVGDRGAVDHPSDGTHVGPGAGGVVEDGGVLGLAVHQVLHHLIARLAEGFSSGIQIETVAGLVLDLGHEDGLTLQARGAGDPVGLGLHANDLRVRVLRDLAQERFAVGRRHPVTRLDPGIFRHDLVEVCLALGVAPGRVLGAQFMQCRRWLGGH